MKRALVALLLAGCAHPIDCVKLTDHVMAIVELTRPAEPSVAAERRARALETCPVVWHAAHPSKATRRKVDCILAASTEAGLVACATPPR